MPTWAQLVALMLVGDGTDVPFHGLLRSEPEQAAHRVWIHGRRYRREAPDGRPTAISDGASVWIFDADHPDRPTRYDAGQIGIGFADQRLTEPPLGPVSLGDVGDVGDVGDLGRLVRPPVRTSLYGRDAWDVEMELESWKSGTFVWTIDARRGYVLRETRSDGSVGDEWLELVVGEPIPSVTFSWDGASTAPSFDASPGAAEKARAAEQRKVEKIGLADVRIPFSGEITLHESKRDGSFELELMPQGYAMLQRRPAGSPQHRGWTTQHTHTWSDDRWDWSLAVTAPLTDAELDAVRAQLPD